MIQADAIVLDDGTYLMDVLPGVADGERLDDMEGASTLKLVLRDFDERLLHGRVMQRYASPNDDVDVELDGAWYRLQKVRRPMRSRLEFTFEDRSAAELRRYTASRVFRAGKFTRNEAARALVRESDLTIPFVTLGSELAPVVTGGGFAKGTRLTVKGTRATSDQLRNMERILRVGVGMKAKRTVLVASIAAAITESAARNLTGGDRDSVGLFQIREMHIPRGERDRRREVEWAARWFFTRAIAEYRKQPGMSAGALAQAVERSAYPERYAQWAGEAQAAVDAFAGDAAKAAVSPKRRARRLVKPQLVRKKGTSTWETLKGWGDEVNWRRFAVRNTVYLVDEESLVAAQPWMILSRDLPGVVDLVWDVDLGKPADKLTVHARASAVTALAGRVIEIQDEGPAVDGRWLVARRRQGLFSPTVELTLKRASAQKAAKVAKAKGRTAGSGEASFAGRFQWPTASRQLTSGFGPRGGRMHDGIDIAVPIGTAVRAAAPGRVEFVGVLGGYGKCITIRHSDKFSTHYAHLDSYETQKGASVAAGEVIARSGNTGRSTGPHLHFEIRTPRAVDPMEYL